MSTTTTATERNLLARNNKADATKAMALITAAAALGAGQGIRYMFSAAITDEDWDAAHAVGVARKAIAIARGRTTTQYRRPDDERIDKEGAMGELIAFDVLGRVADYCAPLVEYRPSRSGLDIGLAGQHFDVKSVSQTSYSCNINRAQHFEKNPLGYILVRIVSDRLVDVYFVSAEDVAGWKVRAGYTPYFAGGMPRAIPLPVESEEPAC